MLMSAHRMKKASKKTHFSVGEAAKKLKISRQAVHKAIEKGTLQAVKKKVVKMEWQIPAESLHSYSVSDLHQAVGKKNN